MISGSNPIALLYKQGDGTTAPENNHLFWFWGGGDGEEQWKGRLASCLDCSLTSMCLYIYICMHIYIYVHTKTWLVG